MSDRVVFQCVHLFDGPVEDRSPAADSGMKFGLTEHLDNVEVGQRSHPNIWRCRADMRRCQVHMLVRGLSVPVWGWKLSTLISGF